MWKPRALARRGTRLLASYFNNFSRCGSLTGEWLPEFDRVSFRVDDPGEAAVDLVFALAVDFDAGSTQLIEKRAEVVDAIVDHRLLCAAFALWAKIFCVGRKERPCGHSLARAFGLGALAPDEADAVLGGLDSKMRRVSVAERFGVVRPQKYSTDTGDARHHIFSAGSTHTAVP